MSQELLDDIARFQLVFCCEDCQHGAAIGGSMRCDVLYPTLPHQKATVANTPEGGVIRFCKMFEAR